MKRRRKVKILATLGPSSSDKAKIKALADSGADVFRINMSHSDHQTLRRLVNTIRAVETEGPRPIGILADLQGPKLRIGKFAHGSIEITPGDTFTLDSDPTPGTQERVYLPHPEILAAIKPDHRLLLDDGRVRLRVTESDETSAKTFVEAGTRLSDRKGVSVPDTTLAMGALTEKDRSDLEAALNAGVDWIALSFVQRPEDLAEVKKVARGRAAVMAKIEKPQAVERLDAIIDQADALMVARGDLGVEVPLERVPGIQKHITRAARSAGKPVVVATQMLESMITAPVPTRAEVSDVSTAVFEGADAVMLSAESASGSFPVEAVATMDRIAIEVERDPNYPNIIYAQRAEPEPTIADAISAGSRQIAETLNLAAICCYTASGATAMRTARERPLTPIISMSPVITTARRLSIVWGLHCVAGKEPDTLEEMIDRACQVATQEKIAEPGQRIIVTAGLPIGTPGATNMLRVAFIGSHGGDLLRK
ncbi:pyruvate kinase [Bauldia sp.]|uniref:pyruvate kinase n=1 Tax=Bauldia sp. TaxID=2575872 RepID=UPI003BAAF350